MKLNSEDYKYLEGNEFSNGYEFKLEENDLLSRLEQIIKLTKGKRVLHIGCCDHVPLIKEKIQNGRWLQKLLDENCSRVVGIDINEMSINFVKQNKLTESDIYCANIAASDFWEKVPKEEFDVVLMGEILEHVDNPVFFLKEIKKNMDEIGFEGIYVITVPNALSFIRDNKARRNIECINSDHRYWFTPYTISKVEICAGMRPVEIFFASDGIGGNGKNAFTERYYVWRERKLKKASTHNSCYADQIISVAKNN